MAEVNTGDGGGGHGKHDKKRAKKASTKIDMTPMVDLAFLLLTFFVLTSTFSKPKAMEINYPADPKDENTKPPKINNALTFILSKDDAIYYYPGEFYPPNNPKGEPPTQLVKTDFSKDGLRKILLDRNDPVRKEIFKLEEKLKTKEIADSTYKRLVIAEKSKKEAVTVLIKADDKATYKNVIDLVDELNISMIGKYAVVDMIPTEYELLQAAEGTTTTTNPK